MRVYLAAVFLVYGGATLVIVDGGVGMITSIGLVVTGGLLAASAYDKVLREIDSLKREIERK